MARTTHREVRLAWRDRLRRFQGASMTVSQFCRAEQVSLTNFYVWRKKLAVERDVPMDNHGEKEGAFLPVNVLAFQPDVRVLLPGGAVLELGAGWSKECLQQLIAATVTATEQTTAEHASGQSTCSQSTCSQSTCSQSTCSQSTCSQSTCGQSACSKQPSNRRLAC